VAEGIAPLLAVSDIQRILHLYTHALDRRRWKPLDHVFHGDARFGFGDIGGGWRDFVCAARSIVDPLGPTRHHDQQHSDRDRRAGGRC
jgi:hypothetical protein